MGHILRRMLVMAMPVSVAMRGIVGLANAVSVL